MPLDDLVQVIDTVKQRIAKHGHVFNETQTRAALIDPLLTALGWDVSDPEIVTPEYRTDVGWADYALQGPGNKPAAVVEAKRLGSFVENHLDQAVNYCIQQGIAYATVTDGSHWQMYRTFEPVPLLDKRVLDVQISSTPAFECALKFLLLWRPNLGPGQPLEANPPVLREVPPAREESAADRPSQIQSDYSTSYVQRNGEAWQQLSSLEIVPGDDPPAAIRFPTGDEYQIKIWRQLVEITLKWLWEREFLKANDLPVRSSSKRFLVNLEPVHPPGNRFKTVCLISGTPLYIDGNISAKASASNARKILQYCGQDPALVGVRVN